MPVPNTIMEHKASSQESAALLFYTEREERCSVEKELHPWSTGPLNLRLPQPGSAPPLHMGERITHHMGERMSLGPDSDSGRPQTLLTVGTQMALDSNSPISQRRTVRPGEGSTCPRPGVMQQVRGWGRTGISLLLPHRPQHSPFPKASWPQTR